LELMSVEHWARSVLDKQHHLAMHSVHRMLMMISRIAMKENV